MDAKAPDTGSFTLRLYSGEGWHVQKDGIDVAGPYAEQKTAARKARQLSGKEAPGAPEITPEPEAPSEPPKGEEKPKAKAKAKKAKADKPKPEASPKSFKRDSKGTSADRHAWLEKARVFATSLLIASGLEIGDNVRVSIGLPFRARGKNVIGQCWHVAASADGHAEVFVSPVLEDSETILGVVTHELIHAALPDGAGHGPAFKKAALAVGLTGKMTATTVGPELEPVFKLWIEENGEYPGAALNPSASGRKKQGTRMLKVYCETCNYTVRTTAKWIAVAVCECPNPDCSSQGEIMRVDGGEEGEGEGE